MWTSIKNDGPPIFYKRKIFEAEDPAYQGSFAIDFVVHEPHTESDDALPIRTINYTDEEFGGISSLDSHPMLISLHGLSGGSYEIYLKHVLAPLVGADRNAMWEACVINSRGCAGHKITSPILYNARGKSQFLRERLLLLALFGRSMFQEFSGIEGSNASSSLNILFLYLSPSLSTIFSCDNTDRDSDLQQLGIVGRLLLGSGKSFQTDPYSVLAFP